MGDFADFMNSPAAAPEQSGGFDAFMKSEALKPSASLPDPATVDELTTAHARNIAEIATRPAGVPPPPTPPLPEGLQSEEQIRANAPVWTNPRTGQRSPMLPPGMTGGPFGILEAPQTGIPRVAAGVEHMAQPGAKAKFGGASEAFRGGLEAASPLIVGDLAATPLRTAAGLVAGSVSQEAIEAGLKKIKVPPEYAAFVGDLAGLIAGIGAHKLTPKAAEAIEAKYEPILKARAERANAPAQPEFNSTGTRIYKPEDIANANRKEPATPQPAAAPEGGSPAQPVATVGAQPGGRSVGPAAIEPGTAQRAEGAVNVDGENPRARGTHSQPGAQQPASQAVHEGQRPGEPVSGLPRVPEGGGPASGSEPQPAAGRESGNIRRVTGSADKPLNAEGRADAGELKKRAANVDRVLAAPNDRSMETARIIHPKAEAADWLEPWKLGAHEGKPLESERDAINDRILNRPDESPGVSPHSGEEGESFNAARDRLVNGANEQAAGRKPGESILNITSGRALGIIDANGDPAKITAPDREFSKPGQLFRREPGGGLQPVDQIEGPGQYFAQHGATDWNASGGSAAGDNPDAMRTMRQPVREAEPQAAAPPAAATETVPPAVTATPQADLAFNMPAPEEGGKSTGPTYMGSGFGALEPLFREAKAEGDRLLAERTAALAELKKAQATPEEKKAGEKIRAYFTAERDLWAARTNQVMDRITRLVLPKIQDREALAIAREFRHHPVELEAFIDGTHPFYGEIDGGSPVGLKNLDKLMPVLRQAQRILAKPTMRERAADEAFTRIAQRDLNEGQKGGWLESRWKSDEYVPHALNAKGTGQVATPPSTAVRQMGNVGKFFGFGERRSDRYPTMVHAVADGVIPKTLDPSALFTIHADQFARARATHLLEGQLVDSGIGKWGDGKSTPADWVPLAPHADEFVHRQPYAVPGSFDPESGESEIRIGMTRLYVPDFIAKALEPITDPDATPKRPLFAKLRTIQRGLKEAILGFSFYHLLTENVMAKVDIGPTGMVKAFQVERESPDFLANERDLIASGGTTSIQGSTMDAYRGLRPGTIPTRAEVLRGYIPGSKSALEAADAITRLTFDNVQRRFKVVSFQLHRDAWMRDNPHATPEQLADAKKGIASYVNGVYGGLHWENMGWARALVEAARAVFLAPDWSGSNIALAKYAFDARLSPRELRPGRGNGRLTGAVTKESVQARLSRAFWTKQLVQGLAENQMLSLLLSGQLSPRPFQVYEGKDKDGRDVFQNVVFRGSAGDAVSLVTKVKTQAASGFDEDGVMGGAAGVLVGVGLFAESKTAPVTRFAIHVGTGHDERGRRVSAGTLATDLLPLPIAVKNAYDQWVGDGSDKYTWSEAVLSQFGSPAQHVAPAGMRWTKEGLVERRVREKPDRSLADELLGRHPE